jgi:hypothetical protein
VRHELNGLQGAGCSYNTTPLDRVLLPRSGLPLSLRGGKRLLVEGTGDIADMSACTDPLSERLTQHDSLPTTSNTRLTREILSGLSSALEHGHEGNQSRFLQAPGSGGRNVEEAMMIDRPPHALVRARRQSLSLPSWNECFKCVFFRCSMTEEQKLRERVRSVIFYSQDDLERTHALSTVYIWPGLNPENEGLKTGRHIMPIPSASFRIPAPDQSLLRKDFNNS